MKRNITGVLLAQLLFCSCLTSTSKGNGSGWTSLPTIQFLTQDFRFAQVRYSVGDSLVIGLLDRERPLDAIPNMRSWTAIVATASGDQEEVDLTSRELPGGRLAIGVTGAAKISTVLSDSVINNNGVVEIINDEESVKVTYTQRLEDIVSELVVSDKTIVKK